MPRQVPPNRIENAYASELRGFVVERVHSAFATFKDEIPRLLEHAHGEARLDGLRVRLDAGQGKRVRQLIEEARQRMNRSILTPDLERLAHDFANRTQRYQRQQLARQVKATLGVDPFIADRRIVALMEAFVDANVGLIRGLTDDVAARVEKSALIAVQDAKLYTDYADELQAKFGFADARAELIARDQIGKLYGQSNAARQRELGVTHFFWRTSNDDRVRDEHDALNGERFSYDDPPSEGLPGEAVQCRCSAEPDFTPIFAELE